MTVFKYFLKIGFRMKFIILAYFAIYLVIGIFNMRASTVGDSLFNEVKPKVVIINNDSSKISKKLTEFIESKSIKPKVMVTEANAEEMIFLEGADSVVIIPNNFSEDFKDGRKGIRIVADPKKAEAIQTETLINRYLQFAKGIEKTYGEVDFEKLTKTMEIESRVTIPIQAGSNNGASLTWYLRFLNFMSYSLMAIYLAVFGNIMREFSDVGVERRNTVSPMSAVELQMQIMSAQVVLASLLAIGFLAAMLFINPGSVSKLNLGAIGINLAVFILSVLGLSTLITSITTKRYALNAISTALSLGLSFISGVIIPLELLSGKAIAVSKLFPVYYFIKANENIFSTVPYTNEVLIQLLFAAFYFLLGLTIIKFKRGERFLPKIA